MWCPNFSYRDGVETGVKEDYDLALEQTREARSEDAKTALGTEDRVSLKSEAEASRAASEALSSTGSHEDVSVER